MKRIIIYSIVTIYSLTSFAFWDSDAFRAKLQNIKDPEFEKISGVRLIGCWYNGNTRWRPGVVVFTEDVWDVQSDNVVIPTTITELLELGKYDYNESYDAWVKESSDWIYDEDGNKIGSIPRRKREEIYDTVTKKNIEVVAEVLSGFSAAYENYMARKIQEGASAEGSSSSGEIASTTKDLDEGLESYTKETEKKAEEAKSEAETVKNAVNDVQDDLTAYNEKPAIEAGRDLSDASKLINDAYNNLIEAIANESMDSLNDAIDDFTSANEKISSALDNLQNCTGDGVSDVRTTLVANGRFLSEIIQKLTSARGDAQRGDWDSAKSKMNEAKHMADALDALSRATKKMKNLMKKIEACKGRLQKESLKLEHLLDVIDYLQKLTDKIYDVKDEINAKATQYMTDINQIGAYLGATNSMAFFSCKRKMKDMTKEEIDRWFKFSVPGKIDDNYGFGASQIGSNEWHFVYDNFASTYSMWAWPLVDDWREGHEGEKVSGYLKFLTHFNLNVMYPRYNGFYEQIDYPGTITNWYAKNIAAPKNWADGTSIIVTNGVFKVPPVDAGYSIKISGTENNSQGVKYVVLGSGSTTNNLTFATASDSNIKVTVSGDAANVTVTFGTYYK